MNNYYVLMILNMLIPLATAQGLKLEAQDENDTGLDDLEGEVFVLIGGLGQYLLDRRAGKTTPLPTIPSALLANA